VHRVVVGLSGASAGARSLAWGIAEAVATGAELVVVHAGHEPGSPGDAPRPGMPWIGSTDLPRSATAPTGRGTEGRGPGRQHHPASRARGSLSSLEMVDRAAASAVAAARRQRGEACVGIHVTPGPADDALLRAAGPYDLIVIGPPGRVGWWARGSTTHQVTSRAPCPVVIVHERGAPPGADAPVVVGCAPVRHGAPPRDGAALSYAFAYAAAHDVPVVAVRVVPGPAGPEDATDLAARVRPWQERYPRVPARRMVLTGDPADGLRRAGERSTLLVVGRSSGPPGRVGRSLIGHACGPVAVVD
jgi:nucleotide-binding universal stress UspA family protein